jgi:hypothetical protein
VPGGSGAGGGGGGGLGAGRLQVQVSVRGMCGAGFMMHGQAERLKIQATAVPGGKAHGHVIRCTTLGCHRDVRHEQLFHPTLLGWNSADCVQA